jgi:predicted Ser/Thr protein kinase
MASSRRGSEPGRATIWTVRPLDPGTEIGAYVIEAPISTGGMGSVHRAHRLADGLEVAIKQPLDDADAVRFRIEARLLERLVHPRVVSVIDHFADAQGAYLVMELVQGSSLDAVLARSGPLPVAEAVEHIRQACEALAYVHDQQVVHRDVKPSNLILADDGIVLVDFGIAREQTTANATRALGTPRYAAPEVLSGTEATSRSDVYGLAATLWALIAGAPPTFLKRVRLPAAGPTVEAALHAGLEPDPQLRLPSAEAFAHALGEGIAERGAPLVLSVARPSVLPDVLETAVRTAAIVFGAAATSIAFLDGDELVYESAWGADADKVVGVRLRPGKGIAAHVAASGRAEAVANCRQDPRFARKIAEGIGYVPHTMLVIPLGPPGRPFGVLQMLDRLDGEPFGPADVERGLAFAELTMAALERDGGKTIPPPSL